MKFNIQLLDVVILARDLPAMGLFRGNIGTVVEQLAPGIFEVEFSDENGRPYAIVALPTEDIEVLPQHRPPRTQ